jgi:hypothetical protein
MRCSLADLVTISLPPPMSYDPEEEGYVELCLHGCYRSFDSGRPVILFSVPDEPPHNQYVGWGDAGPYRHGRQYFWLANYRIVLT